MNRGEDASGTVTLDSVNPVTLTRDTDGNIILHCPQNGDETVLEEEEEGSQQVAKRLRLANEEEAQEDSQDSAPQYSVVTLPISESDEGFEVTMTATEMTEGELHQEGVAQIQIVQDEGSMSPQKSDVSPVSQAWFTTKEDKDTLVNKGHKWKQGMWSKEEIDILMNNIDGYLKGRGIQDPTEIIFEMSKDERKDFYRSIAWGLNRPLFAVYRRVLRMYDNRNHVGKYTADEIDKLKELRGKHGNDWATIGAALGRSASSVKDRCRLMKDTCNTGKWTEDEERRLAEVVHELTGTEVGEVVTAGVSWASVAELVGTRSEKQCRSKWLNYLNWKQSGGTEWTKEHDLYLVRRIAELGAEDENEINWDKLAGGWKSARSPQWLRSKWWTIKRQVANHKELPFPVLLKGLQEMSETQSYSKVVLVGSQGGSASPPVTALQIPMQIPVQITHVANEGSSTTADSETITLNQGALQTFELVPSFHLQPTGTPGTYYIQTTGANQNLPLALSANPTVTLTATASPSSPDQIILHSLTADGLNDNVAMGQSAVIIQTVTSDLCSSEPLEGEELKEAEPCEEEEEGLKAEGEEPAEGTLQSSTEEEAKTEETLDSQAVETTAVDSGMAEGAVLIVPSPNSFIQSGDGITDAMGTDAMGTDSVLPVGSLTDPILQNQEEGLD
ncbi:cyclin-D-binding Myb-like transcription factor 1 [Engraulis encrasicolus]|uniref:cyclin-D-binding Myb-like transcription factor 1 n=1 Tax=Engraulis encrasicolus TaxID=184585 RepID=UPI002FD0590C